MIQTIFSFLFLVLFSSTAFSQMVSQVKNNKVLLELGDISTSKGDDMFCLDTDQKRKGLLKVSQVKGARAVAEIVKGACEKGMAVRLRRTAKGSETAGGSEARPSRSRRAAKTGKAWGVMGGYHMDTATASFRFSGVDHTSTMTGSGFSAVGLFDYDLTSSWQFRGLVGIETFNTSGTVDGNACNGGASANCDFSLMNLAMQGIGKYVINPTSDMRYWVGGGLGYIFALSKSSNVINTSDLSTNWLFTATGGMDIISTGGSFYPISVEYSQYPDSTTVKANYIAVRGGWAKAF